MHLTPILLKDALAALSDVLQEQGLRYDLVVLGAGAIVLGGHAARSTEDLDVVGLRKKELLVPRKPFPPPLQEAIEDVGRAMRLPLRCTGHDKDWLNPGPTVLAQLGTLPPGFRSRLHALRFAALTVWLADRLDLIHLKVLAATDLHRPTRDEALAAARWVAAIDGRPDTFDLEIRPVLASLGHALETLDG